MTTLTLDDDLLARLAAALAGGAVRLVGRDAAASLTVTAAHASAEDGGAAGTEDPLQELREFEAHLRGLPVDPYAEFGFDSADAVRAMREGLERGDPPRTGMQIIRELEAGEHWSLGGNGGAGAA